jgi:hypothetical protein
LRELKNSQKVFMKVDLLALRPPLMGASLITAQMSRSKQSGLGSAAAAGDARTNYSKSNPSGQTTPSGTMSGAMPSTATLCVSTAYCSGVNGDTIAEQCDARKWRDSVQHYGSVGQHTNKFNSCAKLLLPERPQIGVLLALAIFTFVWPQVPNL